MNLLTPQEVADRVRVSVSTVYEWTRRRVLPCYRLGVNGRGKVLISIDDLDALMATFKVDGVGLEGDMKHIR